MNSIDQNCYWLTKANIPLEKKGEAFSEMRMLARAASSLQLLYPAELLSTAENGDMLEILDEDFNQLYRSFNFFPFCNYTLNDLCKYPVLELYELDPEVMDEMKALYEKILSGARTSIATDKQLPEYFCQERFTAERLGFFVQERHLFRGVSLSSGRPYIISVKRVRAAA